MKIHPKMMANDENEKRNNGSKPMNNFQPQKSN